MKIKYNVTIEDIVAFSMSHYKNSSYVRKQNYITKMIIFLAVVCLLLSSEPEPSAATIIAGAIVALIIVFISSRIIRALQKSNVRGLYGEGKNANVFCEHVLEMNDSEITDNTDVAEHKIRISALERIVAYPEYFAIYINAISAYVIPRNNVLEGDFDLFLQEIKRRFELAERRGNAET